MLTRLSRLAAAALLAALLFASCASAPAAIPEDLDAPTLVQRAQEASDSGQYAVALKYYQALIDRFGTDPAYLVAGEYEMAFIAYKQGDEKKAKELFTALLARYDADSSGDLPERYRILAEKLLAKLN